MSLFDDASLVLIPDGAKDGRLYSIRPIEELGGEEVTNGDFATDSDWTKASNWTISGGAAIADGSSQGALSQNITTSVIGKKYKISFTISNYNSGDIRMYYGGQFTPFVSSNGVHSATITATTTEATLMTSINTPFNGYIDNVSVKEAIVPNGDFTFTRGSNLAATRVDENGLIEKGRENLLLQSNQFDTTWATSSASVTSGQSGYDGSNNAWLLTATNTFNRVQQSIGVSGVKRFSVYAKANTNDYLLLGSFEGAHYYATFNLATGAVDSNNINAISPSIEDVGNGWYRCSATWVNTTTEVRIGTVDASGQVAWASTTSGSIYIQDAQLEVGLVATDYIETGATTAQAGILEDLPRIDYSGGASCPALLLEPQRSNLVTQSEYIDSSVGWTLASVSVTDNATTSPEGVTNASKLTSTANFSKTTEVLSLSATTTYTASFWVKDISAGSSVSFVAFDQTNTATLKNENFSSDISTTEWKRLEYSFTTTTAATIQVQFVRDLNSGEEIYVYGFQLEAGSYPTSYIPTYGSSVTRSADSCSKTSATALIGQTEGTIFCDFVFNGNPTNADYNFMILGATGSDFINIAGYNKSLYARVFNGTLQGTINALQMVAGTRYKVAVAYAENDVKMYVNGVDEGSDTSVSIPATSEVAFYRPVFMHSADVNQALVFKTRLSNTELAALTTI